MFGFVANLEVNPFSVESVKRDKKGDIWDWQRSGGKEGNETDENRDQKTGHTSLQDRDSTGCLILANIQRCSWRHLVKSEQKFLMELLSDYLFLSVFCMLNLLNSLPFATIYLWKSNIFDHVKTEEKEKKPLLLSLSKINVCWFKIS